MSTVCKRTVSFLLVLVFCVSLFPQAAFAAEAEQTPAPIEIPAQPESPTPTETPVLPQLVTGISLIAAENKTTVNIGETLMVTALVLPENADNKTVQWSSSDSAVLTVDQTGLVTALTEGKARVIATAQDGSSVYGELVLTVNAPSVIPEPTASPELTPTPEPTAIPEPLAAPDEETVFMVMFFCQPEEATVQVFDSNDDEVLPEDGTYLLPLGEYYYNVICEGYLPILEEELLLDDASISPIEIEVSLEAGELPLRAVANYSGTCGESLIWELDTTTGKLSISGTGAMTDYTGSSSPWYSYRSSIKTVELSSGVTSIGNYAFYCCSSLSSITIPNNVTSIGDYAFDNCSSDLQIAFQGTQEQWDALNTGYSAICMAMAAGTCGDNLTWTIDNNGKLTISGTGAMTDYSSSTETPWYAHRNAIRHVEISSGVTTIGSYAFQGFNSIESYWLPIKGLYSIGDYAFAGCTGLTHLSFPQGVRRIGRYAFSGCSKPYSIVTTRFMEEIGEGAFSDCRSLSSVSIPDSVTTIAASVFSGCSNLRSVTIPDRVTDIGSAAFEGCSSLISIGIPHGVTTIGNYAFCGCSNLRSISIPDSVTTVDGSAFSGCSADLQIIFAGTQEQWDALGTGYVAICLGQVSGICGDRLTWKMDTSTGKLAISGTGEMNSFSSDRDVPWYAYRTAIKSVSLPESISSIGAYAFSGCSSLSSITIPNGVTSIGYSAFSGCSSLSSIIIPDGVQSISDSTFSGCSSLSSITIPNSVVYIESNAFEGCASDLQITFAGTQEQWNALGTGLSATCLGEIGGVCGDSLTWKLDTSSGKLTISGTGWMAYYASTDDVPWYVYRTSIESVSLPESISSIGNYAFYGCSSLSSITIPARVDYIGDSAFSDCSLNLKITFNGTKEQWDALNTGYSATCLARVAGACGDNLTWTIDNNGKLTISGEGAMTDYGLGETPWYSYRASIKSVELPNGIGFICAYAFYDCTNLSHVDFPAGVKTVGEGAFGGNNKLQSVNVRGSVGDWLNISFGHWGYTAFSNPVAMCLQNEQTTGVQPTINFNGSDAVSIRIPEGITSIPIQAFCGWNCIKNLSLADSVVSIESYAFSNCKNLSSVNLGNGLKKIGYYAFGDNEAITTITLPESLHTIDEGAFYRCTGLSSVTIPGTIKTISNGVFSGCERLTVLVIGNGVDSIGYRTFRGCKQLTSITLPDSVTSLGKGAFEEVGTATTNGTAVTLSNQLEAISEDCFKNARVKQIVLPEGVKRIEDKAFQDSRLNTIRLPSSLTYVGKYAFDGCSELKTVQYAGSPEQWNSIEIDIYNEPLKKASPESIYLVIYDANGGTDAPETQTGRYGTSCRLSTQIPRSDEHYFVGWATTPDAEEAEYQPGDTIQPDGTLRLYAVWVGEKYAITLILNGGALKQGIVFDSYISSRAVPLPTARDLSYPGMRFDGWTRSNDPDDKSYVTQIGAEESGDLVFYAKWSEVQVEIQAPDVLSAGKSVKLTATANAALPTAPRFVWALADGAERYASLSSAGLLTAKAVSEAHDIEVLVSDESGQLGTVSFVIRIVPTLTALTISDGSTEYSAGASVPVDLNAGMEYRFTASCVPSDAAENAQIAWTVSDSKGVYGSYTDNGDGSLSILFDENAKLGSITLTATDTVSKKKASLKLNTTHITTELLPVTEAGDGLSAEPTALDPSTALVGGGSRTMPLHMLGSSGKAKITWTIPEEYAPYATVKAGAVRNGVATGTVIAKQVSEPVQIRVDAEVSDNPALYAGIWLWILPQTQLVQITDESGSSVSGKTAYLDLNDGGPCTMDFHAECYPDTASSRLSWSSSDRSEKLGVLTVLDDGSASFRFHDSVAAGKSVTLTATSADGSKKSAKVTLKTMRFAHEIEILGAPAQLMGGKSVTLKTNLATDKTLSDKTVQWSIPAECAGYATIAANGKLSAKAFAGSEPVTITVLARVPFTGAESSVEIQLLPNLEKSLTIFADGEAVNGLTRSCDLKEEVLILDAEVLGLEDDSVSWGPTNPNGAAFFADGDSPFLTLNKAGAVTITAKAADGKTKASFKLTVVKTADMLELQGKDVMLGGSKQTLKAVFTDSEGNVVKPSNSKLIWTLESGAAYAKLSSGGVLTANKVTAVHTVAVSAMTQDGSLNAELLITINPAANNIRICTQEQYETRWSLTGRTVDLNAEDLEQRSIQLLAIGYPYHADSSQVSWKSSSPAVAEVDEDGLVTLKWDEKRGCWKTGKVVITATALDGSKKTAKLTLNFTSLMRELSFENEEYHVPAGKSLSLKTVCNWEATNKKLVWSMSGDTAWFKLSNGKVSAGKVTAPKTVIVTATAADGGGASASCTVIIDP